MDVFNFRNRLVGEYESFSRSFSLIKSGDIQSVVESEYQNGRYWPAPLLQINPHYQPAKTVQELAADGTLHPKCGEIFRVGKDVDAVGEPLRLYKHQIEAISLAAGGNSYVVTTGTGSGKSLAFFIPIIDRVLRAKEKDPEPKTRAIVIYPMNALANSQREELKKFLGDLDGGSSVSVARYTGDESEEARKRIAANPPDILLTNFMMLELILTRFEEVDRAVIDNCRGLEFLVLDELHTYRGRQGADVALLVRRLRQRTQSQNLICVGTSATMASEGAASDRNQVVARVASRLFGQEVKPVHVVTETLRRATPDAFDREKVKPKLAKAMAEPYPDPKDHEAFRKHPVSVWVELVLGIEYGEEDKPRRARPRTLDEAAEALAKDAGGDIEHAREYLQGFLLHAYDCVDDEGRPLFAFKLHQFISGPGRVWSSLEAPGQRHVTLDGQKYAPGRKDENAILFSTYFCRECGQEYHPVWDDSRQGRCFTPRDIDDVKAEDEAVEFGFVMPDAEHQWKGHIEELPDAWLDTSGDEPKVRQNYRKHLPQEVKVAPDGRVGSGLDAWYIPGKFRFCLSCKHVHEALGKDINRLSGLSGEGRSSATTMISLSILRELFGTELPDTLKSDPRKLLGFSDNRQDAALQAGHFNDFVYLLTLRSGLLRALMLSPKKSLSESELASSVFNALGFDSSDPNVLAEYLKRPSDVGLDLRRGKEAMRDLLGHRLLHDLRRGWRFNNPNLEQLKLLDLRYEALDELAASAANFPDAPPVLERIGAEGRQALCRIILDYMRERLCIHSPYLDPHWLDDLKKKSFARLCDPWAFDPDEQPYTSRYLITVKRPRAQRREMDHLISGGPRSRLARLVKYDKVWNESEGGQDLRNLPEEQIVELIESVLRGAARYGLVTKEIIHADVAGWRIQGDILQWVLVQAGPAEQEPVNRFFRQLYRLTANLLGEDGHPLFQFEAQEHTAQVDGDQRQILEARFRFGKDDCESWAKQHPDDPPLQRLPVMYCSPTMELGVDISALNFVYLRNVPPTPANYAQRSGRAGRSGQPALVVTYCASLSPHDQYFFAHPERMVHGEVKAPTLDLANKDLITSHLNAVWLACTQKKLTPSVANMLDLDHPEMPVQAEYRDRFAAPEVSTAAQAAVDEVLKSLNDELDPDRAPWFDENFGPQSVSDAPAAFDQAINRWRDLYRATGRQMELSNKIRGSHAVTQKDRNEAGRRYQDAARQRDALLRSSSSLNSDFYTYRYLAGQGFLPGYNFPRLPLMAWIPSTKQRSGKIEEGTMVSRPRFLALSEFGPRSLIYHQGRMFRVTRAMLNVTGDDQIGAGGGTLPTTAARVCTVCGYGHLADPGGEPKADVCESCGGALSDQGRINALYRIENVATTPVERISVNDEERQRQGFDMQTTFRFAGTHSGALQRTASVARDEEGAILSLQFGQSATVWRINKGWRRRKDPKQLGFYINPLTGGWSKSDDPNADEKERDEGQPDAVQPQRIVPYVEDRRNILILRPPQHTAWPAETMATLQMAIKRGIEQVFQIEESELVAEPLPSRDERTGLLFYEAAEGGAGVLTRLATESGALARVAAAALEAMHFNPPQAGESWKFDEMSDREQTTADGNRICETACYRCLLSYFNQPDHDLLDRWDAANEGLALRVLVRLTQSVVEPAGSDLATAPPVSDLAKQWLDEVRRRGLREPQAVDVSFGDGGIAAFQYKEDPRAMIFFGEPDSASRTFLADRDYQVVAFPTDPAGWPEVFGAAADIFHRPEPTA